MGYFDKLLSHLDNPSMAPFKEFIVDVESFLQDAMNHVDAEVARLEAKIDALMGHEPAPAEAAPTAEPEKATPVEVPEEKPAEAASEDDDEHEEDPGTAEVT